MNKNISYRSAELLKKLNNLGKNFFTIEEANKLLQNNNRESVKRLLVYMAKRGLILRIKDGLYNLIPYEEDPNTYFPNWHLTAEQLVKPAEYYIGFYSALDIHGLITQPSLTEQIVTQKQFSPKSRTIGKVKFEFVTLGEKRFFGFKKFRINDYDKIYCSDIEKTIIDSLYKPDYSGGITEITKAIFRAKDKINENKLLQYLFKFDTKAVNKRIGFILSQLGLFESVTQGLSLQLTDSYALLDPALPKQGKHYSSWKIIDNVNIESAIKSINT